MRLYAHRRLAGHARALVRGPLRRRGDVTYRVVSTAGVNTVNSPIPRPSRTVRGSGFAGNGTRKSVEGGGRGRLSNENMARARARPFSLGVFFPTLTRYDEASFYGNNAVVLARPRAGLAFSLFRASLSALDARANVVPSPFPVRVCRARTPSLRRTDDESSPAWRGRARILRKNQCARIRRSTCAVRSCALR